MTTLAQKTTDALDTLLDIYEAREAGRDPHFVPFTTEQRAQYAQHFMDAVVGPLDELVQANEGATLDVTYNRTTKMVHVTVHCEDPAVIEAMFLGLNPREDNDPLAPFNDANTVTYGIA